jgi:hypothetical protein
MNHFSEKNVVEKNFEEMELLDNKPQVIRPDILAKKTKQNREA